MMAEPEPAMMAEEEPVMMESEPMMEAEQAPSSLAAEPEAPVFGEEMVEATAEEPYGEVPEETSAVEGVVVEGVAAEEPQAEVLGETGRSQTTEGEAMLAVGHAAYARKDWPAAMKAFQQSAEAGSAEGAWELSLMHAHGKTGVVDKEEARKWLKIAAEGGAVKAQMFLAQMSTFGRGGYEKDESVAFEYLTRAADQGNAHATHQLGVRYLYAVGVEQDLDKAIEHFDKAIELGSADAVKDREIAQKKKKMSFTRGIKKQISGLPMIGRSKSKRNTVESSLRIKAASAPLKSPSSSRQTSRQSTPAQSPVASPTSQPAFEEEAVPSPTAGAKRPAPAAAAAAAKRPAIREPSPRAAAEAAETPPRARFVERADTWEAPPAAAAPEQALRKFAFAYGAIVLIGVGLAVASEYL